MRRHGFYGNVIHNVATTLTRRVYFDRFAYESSKAVISSTLILDTICRAVHPGRDAGYYQGAIHNTSVERSQRQEWVSSEPRDVGSGVTIDCAVKAQRGCG